MKNRNRDPEGTHLPLIEQARARAMGWKHTARKWLAGTMDAAEGDVPPEGTPPKLEEETGSRLPVIAASRRIPDTAQTWSSLLEGGRIMDPPYDPWALVCAADESDTLPTAIDAMAVNITGFGYDFAPLFPTTDPDTGGEVPPPPEAKAQREDLALFMAGLSPEDGILGLLDKADRDLETIGWASIEVLRNREGRISGLEHIPSYTIRLAPESAPELVAYTIRHPETGELVTFQRWRRFRLFAQVKEGRVTWFKSFGDPRHVNWKTGEVRPATEKAWGVESGNSLEATELIYLRRYHPATPYGVPRWIGVVPHVRAARSAAELMVDWFDNAPIGVKLALIAGGRWKAGAVEALQDQVDHGGRGQANAWNILALEGETDSGRDPMDETRDLAPRVAVEDLSTNLPEGLYRGRDSLIDRSAVRVRGSFRLGGIYYGDSEAESNRAAADTARAIGEEQVIGPVRRGRWEYLFNTLILPTLGINLWSIKFKGATTADDSEGLAKSMAAIIQGGGASPNQLRTWWAELTGQPVEQVGEPWADLPLPLVLALIAAKLDPNLPIGETMAAAAEQAKAAQEAQAEQAKAAMEARQAGGQEPPPGGGAGKPPGKAPPPSGKAPAPKASPPPGARVAKALDAAQALLSLRDHLAGALEAEGAPELAEAVRDTWNQDG